MQLQPSDSLSSKPLPEDDIDQLFQKLERLEAPGDLVKQIFAGIEQLPGAPLYSRHGQDQIDPQASEKALDAST